MADVATLGIGVDLRELQAATRALNDLNRAAQQAEESARRIRAAGDGIGDAGDGLNNFGDQARDAADATDDLGESAIRTSRILEFLRGILLGFVSLQVAQDILRTADSMQSLDNQIKLVTGSESAMVAVRKELLAISNRTFADIEATSSLYIKSSRALEQYGYTQKEVLDFVEATNNAMRVGGVGAQEQASALFQLSQALGSGRLQGDEFRNISEAAPIMLDVLSKHLGKTRAEIRAMASDGQLTSEVIVGAMTAAGGELAKLASQMEITLGGALAVLKNNFSSLVHDVVNGTGAMSVLAGAVKWVADNLQTIAQVAGAIGFAYLLQMFNSVSVTAYKAGYAVGTLFRLLLANPFVAVAAAIVGVLVATGELQNAFDALGAIGGDVLDLIVIGYRGLADLVTAVFNEITRSADSATGEQMGIFNGFFDDVGGGFWGLLEGIAKVFDAFAAVIASAVEWGVDAFMDLWTAVQNGAIGAARIAIGAVEDLVNSAINGINRVIELANKVPTVSIGTVGKIDLRSRFSTPPQERVGRSFGQIFTDRATLQNEKGLRNYVLNKKNSVLDRQADGVGGGGGKRPKPPKPGGGGGGRGGRGGRGGGKSDAENLNDRYLKELASLQGKLSDIKSEFADLDQYGFKNQFTTLRDFNQELENANGRYSKFNAEQKAAIRNVVEQIHAQEQLNAVQAFRLGSKRNMDDIAFEIGLIGQAEDAVKRLRFERELDNKAKELSVGMSPEYVGQIWAEVSAIKAQREELEGLRNRKQDKHDNDWIGGIRDGISKYVQSVGTLRDNIANMVSGTFDSLGNALGEFVTTGKLNFRELTASILKDLAKILMRMAIMRAISAMFGGTAQANGGAWQGGLQFFANGGVFTNQIVGRPTLFAHGGGFGVMGEAGPEAIMPLTRAANGKLGVVAHGGGGVQNNVSINVSIDRSGNAESTEQADQEQGRQLAKAMESKIVEVLARESRPGGMLYKPA